MKSNHLKTLLSGMRPTGRLHLGHYFGVLSSWIKLQNKCKCYFMASDWHALTSDYVDTSMINNNTLEMLADWITIGIDYKQSIIFQQSKVPQHSELFLILSMLTPLSWLKRCPTYKRQIKEIKNKDLNNYGFLGYPVLMAADILLYKAEIVPIGDDQLSHLEFTRDIARRFNNFYGNILIEPKEKLNKISRIPGLDGRKMSKSYYNTILLGETNDILKKKIENLFTDPLKIRRHDRGHPDDCVVFTFHKIINTEYSDIRKKCIIGSIWCMLCKKYLMEILSEFMGPLEKKRKNIISDKTFLEKIIKMGSQKAEAIAQNTIDEIRKAIKF
ncbi:MAG: tryptophan--tRNA ligase [Endomicrobium sp.]|nr:tryptophan--tRNA ligase [Endomicrobium sp.]